MVTYQHKVPSSARSAEAFEASAQRRASAFLIASDVPSTHDPTFHLPLFYLYFFHHLFRPSSFFLHHNTSNNPLHHSINRSTRAPRAQPSILHRILECSTSIRDLTRHFILANFASSSLGISSKLTVSIIQLPYSRTHPPIILHLIYGI